MRAFVLGLMSFLLLNRIGNLSLQKVYLNSTFYADVGGISVAYTVVGPSLDSRRAPVVFLHGFYSSSGVFSQLAGELSREVPCILIDLPPFGFSGKDAGFDYRLANLASLVIELLGRLGVQKFSLVGHSMGGHVALLVAQNLPSNVEKLVLLSPAYDFARILREKVEKYTPLKSVVSEQRDPARRILAGTLVEVFNNAYPLRALSIIFSEPKVYRYPSLQKNFKANYERSYFGTLALDDAVLFKFLTDNLNVGGFDVDFSKITCDTLIVHGRGDSVVPVSVAEYLNRHLKCSVLELVDDAGHYPFLYEPVRRRIVDFLVRR